MCLMHTHALYLHRRHPVPTAVKEQRCTKLLAGVNLTLMLSQSPEKSTLTLYWFDLAQEIGACPLCGIYTFRHFRTEVAYRHNRQLAACQSQANQWL